MEFSLNWINIVSAVIILIIGIISGRFLSGFIKKIIEEIELERIIKKTGFKIHLGKYLYLSIRYVFYFGAFVLALRELGFSNRGLEILFLVIFILIIIFIALAFKDIIPNLIARFIFLGKYDLKKGDNIKIDNIEGTIQDIGLLETKIKQNKETIYIPNSILVKKVVKKK